jgi:hypothetical protein
MAQSALATDANGPPALATDAEESSEAVQKSDPHTTNGKGDIDLSQAAYFHRLTHKYFGVVAHPRIMEPTNQR